MKQIFSSKKASMAFCVCVLAFIVIIVEIIVNRFPVPLEYLTGLIGITIASFEIGQGVADHGKEKAKIENGGK